jgi:hypothetical protein
MEMTIEKINPKIKIKNISNKFEIIILPCYKESKFKNYYYEDSILFYKIIESQMKEVKIDFNDDLTNVKEFGIHDSSIILPLIEVSIEISTQLLINIISIFLASKIPDVEKREKQEITLEIIAKKTENEEFRKISYKGSFENLKKIDIDFKKIFKNE